MNILLDIHSVLRWIIVVVGLAALVNFLVGWARKSAFSGVDRGLSSGFSGLMDLQVTFKKAANRHAVGFLAVLCAMILVVIGVARLPGGWSR